MSVYSTLEFQEVRVRKIVNVHKHVDGPWFWGKYTAHPYVGCRSGCEFCYSRGSRYLGRRDPDTFDTLIQVKVNAVELLRKELSRLEHEVISVGDWQQPAEDRYQLSRGMLGVVRDLGFPLFIIERSPLLTRDMDLLMDINRQAWVGVLFSISNVDPILKRAFEPRSPGVKRRLQAMAKLAEAGIQVGTSMMPIIPFVGDDEQHLEDMVRATKDHGGVCVLGGGLTMDGIQAERTLEAARRFDPALEARWRELYNWEPGAKPSYGPSGAYNARLGLLLRELCTRHGLLDRLPRYIPPGPLAVNKRIAERLFLKTYDLELEQAKDYRIWAYRKAAWTVDEWPESIAKLYTARGEAGLRELPGIGKKLAGEIARWLREDAIERPAATEGSLQEGQQQGDAMDTKALATQTRELLAHFDPGDLRATAEALQAVWLQGETYRAEGVALLKAEQVEALQASGVKVPALKAVGKEMGRVAGKRVDDFLPLARLLWDEYGREGRIVASVALGRMELTDPDWVMPVIRELCRRCVAWEDCDQLAMQGLEPVVRKKPEVYLARLAAWIAEENKWVRRVAVTVAGRLPMKRPKYTAQCLALVEPLLTEPDLDVRRAVSFAIRMGARGDPALVREFLRQHAGSDDEATIWTLCDAIRSMTKKFLPEFVPLLSLYEQWAADPALSAKDRRSVESAVKTLRRVA